MSSTLSGLSSTSPPTLEDVVDEISDRIVLGESPTLAEYRGRFPDLADELAEFFPTLLALDDVGRSEAEPDSLDSADSNPSLPERLGDYRILREVGRGGMGIVYEAVQESLGRHVALKVLPYFAALKESRLQRFHRESRSAARLHHASIVPVFGVGEHDGVYYYVMQLIDGHGLDTVIEQLHQLRRARRSLTSIEPVTVDSTPRDSATQAVDADNPAVASDCSREAVSSTTELSFPGLSALTRDGSDASSILRDSSWDQTRSAYFRNVAAIGAQVADALHYAHQQGVLHRDVKPSNLLLDVAGKVWLVDFGLAHDDQADELTDQGDAVGTLRYMAPERLRGEATERGDVYGLGLTLFEMLTLRPAFSATHRADLVAQIENSEPAPLRRIDPLIPRDVETIILKSIAKDPARRYATAGDLADDLRRFLEHRPIRARRVTWAERLWRLCRRNPGVASLSVTTIVLLVAVVASLFVSRARISAEKDITLEALESEREALQELATSLSREQHTNYFHRVARAARLIERGQLGVAEVMLEECPATLRNWEWQHLMDRCRGSEPVVIRNQLGWPLRLEVSPEGKHFAVASTGILLAAGEARVRELESGREVCTVRQPGIIQDVNFTANGQQLLTLGIDQSLRVWSLPDGELLKQQTIGAGNSGGFTISRQTNRIAVGCNDGTIRLYSVDDMPDAQPNPVLSTITRLLSPSADAVSDDGASKTADRADGPLVIDAHGGVITHVRFAPDGRLVSGDWQGRLHFWNPETGEELASLQAHDSVAGLFRFTRDGRQMISCDLYGHARVWDLETLTELRTFQASFGPLAGMDVSADGTRLACATWDQSVAVWDITTGTQAVTLSAHEMIPTDVRFSPDGRTIISSSIDHCVRLWQTEGINLETDNSRTVLETPEMPTELVFSPDASRLGIVAGVRSAIVDIKSGDVVVDLPASPRDRIVKLALRPDGTFVTSTFHEDVTIWNVDGRPIRNFNAGTGGALAQALSPDGKLLAISSQAGVLRVIDVDLGQSRFDVPNTGMTYTCLQFSRDGSVLAAGGLITGVHLFDTKTGHLIRRIACPSLAVTGIGFGPTPNDLAIGTWDGSAFVLDPASDEWLRLPMPTDGQAGRVVFAVTFNQDGTSLATTQMDNSLLIWDRAERKLLRRLDRLVGYAAGNAFSPDGSQIATGSGHNRRGEVRLWDLE